jgi:hypothetical protein
MEQRVAPHKHAIKKHDLVPINWLLDHTYEFSYGSHNEHSTLRGILYDHYKYFLGNIFQPYGSLTYGQVTYYLPQTIT